jgi:manganese-dependent inorganic pyrophosphatase
MPAADMAGLMAAAIVSDTVMFKSPTSTPQDVAVANRLARIANISLDELGKAIFAATSGADKPVDELLNTDYKEFHIAGHSLAVSQITCMDSDSFLARKDEFLACMQKLKQDKNLEMVILMITDVLQEGSQLLFCGDEEEIRQAFNLKAGVNSGFVPNLMSRKKQMIPTLSSLWG